MFVVNQQAPINEFVAALVKLRELSKKDLGTNRLSGITVQLSRILEHLERIDVNDLAFVPPGVLKNLNEIITRANQYFAQYIETAAHHERVDTPYNSRSHMFVLTPENLEKWQTEFAQFEAGAFSATGNILTHQMWRRSERSSGASLQVDVGQEFDETAVVWKYMPLKNLFKSVEGDGIWFSSLTKLRDWSRAQERPGIPDTHEGEVPKALTQLKDHFEAMQRGAMSGKSFLLKYPFARGCQEKLEKILNTTFQHDCLFTASWVLRGSEDANMWTAYAEDGRGVALKTTVGRLLSASWKIPFSVSGLVEGQPTFGRLVMQPVRYMDFTGAAKFKSVNECYIPFLKRDEFSAERELRLLGHSNIPLPKGGLVVSCNLRKLLTEIVVGPKAEMESVRQRIVVEAPLLSSIPLKDSVLRAR